MSDMSPTVPFGCSINNRYMVVYLCLSSRHLYTRCTLADVPTFPIVSMKRGVSLNFLKQKSFRFFSPSIHFVIYIGQLFLSIISAAVELASKLP